MTNPSYYTESLSVLDLINPNWFINISIQKYIPPSEPLYANGTIVFLVTMAALPANEDDILDVIHCNECVEECLTSKGI